MPNKELEDLIQRAIVNRLHKWKSDNDYQLISEEIQRIFPIDKNNVFVNLEAPKTYASIDDILDEFPCYSFKISKENLRTLLSECKDHKSTDSCINIEYLVSNISDYNPIKYIVSLNKQQLCDFINKKLNSIDFSLLKKAFNNTQIEISPENYEDSYLYLSQIMLAIDKIMKPIQERFETAFANYSCPERIIYDDIEIEIDLIYKEIQKEANNFHKTYLANNRLDVLEYPSRNPHRTATTGDQLDSYIKGLYSKGVYIEEDLQRKADIKNFPKKFDLLQKRIFDLNKELYERIIKLKQEQDVRQQERNEADEDSDEDEYDYSIIVGSIEESEVNEIIELGKRIDQYYDTTEDIQGCIYFIVQEQIRLAKDKLEPLTSNIIDREDVLRQIKIFEAKLNKLQSDLSEDLALDNNKYLLHQLELLPKAAKEINNITIDLFLNIRKLPYTTEEEVKRYLDDSANEICSSLNEKEIKKSQNEIIKHRLESYYERFDSTLELNNEREKLLQVIYEEIELTYVATSHQDMQKILELKLPKVANNILTYMALFCVDSDLNNSESKRIFVPVDIEIDEENFLHAPRRYDTQGKAQPSTDSSARDDDQVYDSDQNQVIHAFKHEDQVFKDTIGERRGKKYSVTTALDLTPPPFSSLQKSLFSKISNHSERVFTTALRKPKTIDSIIKNLEKKLRELKPEKPNSSDSKQKHKVYSLTIIAYSRKTVCQHCTRALIAQLNDTEPNTSFLAQLDARINQSPLLRTSAKPAEKENDIRLRRSTIVIAGEEYKEDPQALLHRDFPQTSFVSKLSLSRPGVLDLKKTKKSSFVEIIRSGIKAFPRRKIISGGACISSDQIAGKISKSDQNYTAKKSSGAFPFTRRVELRKIPSHYK